MLRPTCISYTFWPFVWSWLFPNKLFTLYQDNFSSEKKKGHRQDRTLENVSQEMVNQKKTQGVHWKIRPMSTMLTFYNCTRTAIKKDLKQLVAKIYIWGPITSLEKNASVNFDWGFISLCQLTVHSFHCKIQVFVFCVCACIISF